MSRILSLDHLAAHFEGQGLTVDRSAGEDRLLVPVSSGAFETTAIVVWPSDVALMNLLLPLRFALVDDHVPALCEACLRLDNLLVLPGFGLDLDRGLPYFRTVTPRDTDGGLEAAAVDRAIQAAASTAGRFAPTLSMVASGEMTSQQLVEMLTS